METSTRQPPSLDSIRKTLGFDGLEQTTCTLGYQAGDEQTQTIVSHPRQTLPVQDGADRPGDEFRALLPREGAWGGVMFAQRSGRDLGARAGGDRLRKR